MLKEVKAVLFDLDGTLVDSMWMWGAIDVEYLGRRGHQLPPSLQHEIEGMSFSETAVYFKEYFHLPDSLDEIQAEWVAMARDKYANEVEMKPGALSFLKYLKEQGIRTGIATSNNRELLEAVLDAKGIFSWFDCCMTACEAGAGKPAPDIYLKVAERLETKPENCLVFEDTYAGAMAGSRAGMSVCAMADPYSKAKREDIMGIADYYIESFDQVLDGSFLKLKD